MRNIIPSILPSLVESVEPSLLRLFAFGSSLPPVLEHLVLWAPGQLQDGADILDPYPDAPNPDPDAPFGIYRRDKSRAEPLNPMKVSHSHCLTLASGALIVMAGHGTLVSSGGTAVLAYDDTTLTEITPGTVFYLKFSDGSVFPCAEGAGSSIYSTEGDEGVVSVSDWTVYQDEYHYNVASGYWMNGDGAKYPHAIAGFTSAHPTGTWNQAESKYVLPDYPAIIAADALEGPYLNVPRTEAEILAYVEGKGSVYYCKERGLKVYEEILVGQEQIEAAADCLVNSSTWVDDQSNVWADDNGNIWVTPEGE